MIKVKDKKAQYAKFLEAARSIEYDKDKAPFEAKPKDGGFQKSKRSTVK